MTMCINPPVRNYDEPQIINGASPSPPNVFLELYFPMASTRKTRCFLQSHPPTPCLATPCVNGWSPSMSEVATTALTS